MGVCNEFNFISKFSALHHFMATMPFATYCHDRLVKSHVEPIFRPLQNNEGKFPNLGLQPPFAHQFWDDNPNYSSKWFQPA